MEPITWGTIFSAVKAGATIVDENKRKSLLHELSVTFSKKRKIVVFGVSGAGKSQFVRSLKKDILIASRTELTEHIIHVVGDFKVEFIDTPGQSGKAKQRKDEIIKILQNGVEGIINVCSYGYEENPDYLASDIFDGSTVKDSHLRSCRKLEIDSTSEWLSLIRPKDVRWVINLINKGDLWWDEMREVEKYYNEGEHGAPFQKLSEYTTVVNLPYCSLIKPYYNINRPSAFGDIQKAQMQNNLIHTIENLLKG